MPPLLGKCTQFVKPNPCPDPDAHCAATVSYNLTGWLEKNKAPLNDTIVEWIKNGCNSLAGKLEGQSAGQVFVGFFCSLITSPSSEVMVVAMLAARDVRNSLGKNLSLVRETTGLNLWMVRPRQL